MPIFEGVQLSASLVRTALESASRDGHFSSRDLAVGIPETDCPPHRMPIAVKAILLVEDSMGRVSFSPDGWEWHPGRESTKPQRTSRSAFIGRLCEDLEMAAAPSPDLDRRIAAVAGTFGMEAVPSYTTDPALALGLIERDFPSDERHYPKIETPRMTQLSSRFTYRHTFPLTFYPPRPLRVGNTIVRRTFSDWWAQNEAMATCQLYLQMHYWQEIKDLTSRWPKIRADEFELDIFRDKKQLGDLGATFPTEARYRSDEYPSGLPWLNPDNWSYPADEQVVALPRADSWRNSASWSPNAPDEIAVTASTMRADGVRRVENPEIDDGKVFVWAVDPTSGPELAEAFPNAESDLIDLLNANGAATLIACRYEDSRKPTASIAFGRTVDVFDGKVHYDLDIARFRAHGGLAEDGLLYAVYRQILCDYEAMYSSIAQAGYVVKRLYTGISCASNISKSDLAEEIADLAGMAQDSVFGAEGWYMPNNLDFDEVEVDRPCILMSRSQTPHY